MHFKGQRGIEKNGRPPTWIQPSNFLELRQFLKDIETHPRYPDLMQQPSFQDALSVLKNALAQHPRSRPRSLFPNIYPDYSTDGFKTQALFEASHAGRRLIFPQGCSDAAPQNPSGPSSSHTSPPP